MPVAKHTVLTPPSSRVSPGFERGRGRGALPGVLMRALDRALKSADQVLDALVPILHRGVYGHVHTLAFGTRKSVGMNVVRT